VLPSAPVNFGRRRGAAWDGGAYLYAMEGQNGREARRYDLQAAEPGLPLPGARRLLKEGGARGPAASCMCCAA